MSTEDRFVTVPQIIRDECPLPDGFYFREETKDHWAGLRDEVGGITPWWISRNYATGSYYLHHWTRKDKDINLPMPPETTNEELWRCVYAQFILGDDNA